MGASDVLKDQQAIAMKQSYYTAYWNNAKHPIRLERVISNIYKDRSLPKPDVNVEEFQKRKRRFEELGGFQKQY